MMEQNNSKSIEDTLEESLDITLSSIGMYSNKEIAEKLEKLEKLEKMVMKITNSATSSISLVQTQLAMQMGEKFGEMKNQMDGLGKENANFKEEMANMKKELEDFKKNFGKLGEENANLKEEMANMKKASEGLKENMQKLGQENDNLKEEMANMKKAFEGVKKNMQKLGEENDNLKEGNAEKDRGMGKMKKELNKMKESTNYETNEQQFGNGSQQPNDPPQHEEEPNAPVQLHNRYHHHDGTIPVAQLCYPDMRNTFSYCLHCRSYVNNYPGSHAATVHKELLSNPNAQVKARAQLLVAKADTLQRALHEQAHLTTFQNHQFAVDLLTNLQGKSVEAQFETIRRFMLKTGTIVLRPNQTVEDVVNKYIFGQKLETVAEFEPRAENEKELCKEWFTKYAEMNKQYAAKLVGTKTTEIFQDLFPDGNLGSLFLEALKKGRSRGKKAENGGKSSRIG